MTRDRCRTRAADIHTDDPATRAALRDKLRTIRTDLRISQSGLGRALGCTTDAVSWQERRGGGNIGIAYAQGWARMLGHRLLLVPHGLPEPATATEVASFHAMAEDPNPTTADMWHRHAIITHLRGVRETLGLSAREVSRSLDINQSSTTLLEMAQRDPTVGSYQRYARVLGGWLGLELENTTTTEE